MFQVLRMFLPTVYPAVQIICPFKHCCHRHQQAVRDCKLHRKMMKVLLPSARLLQVHAVELSYYVMGCYTVAPLQSCRNVLSFLWAGEGVYYRNFTMGKGILALKRYVLWWNNVYGLQVWLNILPNIYLSVMYVSVKSLQINVQEAYCNRCLFQFNLGQTFPWILLLICQ